LTDRDTSPTSALDPQTPEEWAALRQLGHRMVDEMVEHLRTVRERPVWQSMPDPVRQALTDQPVPRQGVGEEAAYTAFREQILPYPLGNTHPRFWGWVNGTGTPLAMLAEMLTAGMNTNVGGFDQSATLVERQVIAWLAELLGFPKDAGGLLLSGGSMANVVALAAARNARAGFDIRAEGIHGGPPLAVYASNQVHNSVTKAVELLGLGRRALRLTPVGEDWTVDVEALRAQIRADRAADIHPVCVVANAGTVNTGALDDLDALADLCTEEGLWLHVDGAFGALAALSPALLQSRPALHGLARADSVAFDLHKWMYLPYEAGCTLVRRPDALGDSFRAPASYLTPIEGGVLKTPMVFAEQGLQLSRGFRALKVWLSWKAHGIDRYIRAIERNVEQAASLGRRIEREPELELLAPVPLNIVCFRYRPEGMVEGDALNGLNQRLLVALQESGVAVPSSTVLHDRFAIRVAITNHRTALEDLDLLVEEVLRLGRGSLGP
jgi:aromatic-L-amino-acid/L-tryptophan decarboxylase